MIAWDLQPQRRRPWGTPGRWWSARCLHRVRCRGEIRPIALPIYAGSGASVRPPGWQKTSLLLFRFWSIGPPLGSWATASQITSGQPRSGAGLKDWGRAPLTKRAPLGGDSETRTSESPRRCPLGKLTGSPRKLERDRLPTVLAIPANPRCRAVNPDGLPGVCLASLHGTCDIAIIGDNAVPRVRRAAVVIR
jgi:hypothetical protein